MREKRHVPVDGNPEEKGDCIVDISLFWGVSRSTNRLLQSWVPCGANEHSWLLEYYLDNLNAVGNLIPHTRNSCTCLALRQGGKIYTLAAAKLLEPEQTHIKKYHNQNEKS